MHGPEGADEREPRDEEPEEDDVRDGADVGILYLLAWGVFFGGGVIG